MSDFDVIVVGLGAMGSGAAFHLARRGVRVLGLEQFSIPHALGSSHGYSRMIRLAYYEHPDYVPLLRRAYELWDELERLSGQKLLYLTGGLYAGPEGGGLVAGSLAAARQHGLEHDRLTAAEVAGRFPQFRLPGDFVAVHEHRAGFLLPEKVVAAHAELALRAGAELHGHETVTAWEADGGGVSVTTSRARYRARHLVFCSGPWTGKVLKGLAVPLLVTRQTLGWVWPRRPELFSLGRFPVWAIERPDGSLDYGFPMMGENPGLKLAHHGPSVPTDPDQVNRNILAGDEEDVRHAIPLYLPDADGPLLSLRVCLYTNSPDHHFILDRHPGHANVTIAAGFSGHGFKFASVIGEALADLATRGGSDLPIAFLGLKRFS